MSNPPPEKQIPFVGPRPFERSDTSLFKGRSQEAQDLLTLFLSRRLVLLYSPSGAGKTSLLKAKLIPDLEQQQAFEVLPVGRVGDSIVPPENYKGNLFIFNLLASLGICDRPEVLAADHMSLNQFLLNVGYDGKAFVYFDEETADSEPALEEAEEALEIPINPRALIIDQFEEIFTTHPELEAERIAFFRQIGEAMANDPYLYILISMRGDYLFRIIPYVHLLPNSLRARFQLQRLQRAGALEAICEPAAEAGRPFDSDVAEALVACLRRVRVAADGASDGERPLGDFVEAMQLQVVCQQLWRRLAERPGNTISMEDVAWAVGSSLRGEEKQADALELFVDNALAHYYETSVAQVMAHLHNKGFEHFDEHMVRRWFSKELITEAGTRNLLARMGTETKGLPETAVTYLDKHLYLIRNELRAGNSFVELVHDSFVEPIRAANRKWQKNLEQRVPWLTTARQYAKNPQPGLLLADYNSLQAARKRLAEEAEKGDFPPSTQKFLEAYLEKGEEAYQRQLIHDIPWLNSARQYAETQNPDLLFAGKTLKLALEQAAQAKAKGNLPSLVDDFLQASVETERKQEIKRLRQQGEAQRREALNQQELAHERSLREQANIAAKRQGRLTRIAFIIGGIAVVMAIVAFFARADAQNSEATALVDRATALAAEATALVDRATAQAAEATALVDRELAKNAEAAAEAAQKIADSLRLATLAREYLKNGQTTSALLLSVEANKGLSAVTNHEALILTQDIINGSLLESLFAFSDETTNQVPPEIYFSRSLQPPDNIILTTIFPGPEPGTLATVQDGAIVYWSFDSTITKTLVLTDTTRPITEATINQNGSMLALLHEQTIEVYSLTNGVVKDSFSPIEIDDNAQVTSVSMTFNADGTHFAVVTCRKYESSLDLPKDPSDPISTTTRDADEAVPETNCQLEIYGEPIQCDLQLSKVTAVAYLEKSNHIIVTGEREVDSQQQLYLLDSQTCRQNVVPLPSGHNIQTLIVLPSIDGQADFLVTAGTYMQWWRIDSELTGSPVLHPVGSLLELSNPIKTSLFSAPEQIFVTLDEANNIISYNANLEQWPQISCGIANRNLTYTEWENVFPLDELDNYPETCAHYGYPEFGIHVSVAQYQLQQAANDLQQCDLDSAESKFSAAQNFAQKSTEQTLIEGEFSSWATEELLRQRVSGIYCESITNALGQLVGSNIIGNDLLDIANIIRRGKVLLDQAQYGDALTEYERASNKITDILPEEFQSIFDNYLVGVYSDLCTSQLTDNFTEACSRLPSFARTLSLETKNLGNIEEDPIWEFEATKGEFITIVMNTTDSSLDPYVTLLDANGVLLASEDDYRSFQYSKITLYPIPESGSYYIRSSGLGSETSGHFELIATKIYPTPITSGNSQIASIEIDQLWSFEAQLGDVFDISLTFAEDLFETRLSLLDSQGNRLNSQDSFGSAITFSDLPIFKSGTCIHINNRAGRSRGQPRHIWEWWYTGFRKRVGAPLQVHGVRAGRVQLWDSDDSDNQFANPPTCVTARSHPLT